MAASPPRKVPTTQDRRCLPPQKHQQQLPATNAPLPTTPPTSIGMSMFTSDNEDDDQETEIEKALMDEQLETATIENRATPDALPLELAAS